MLINSKVRVVTLVLTTSLLMIIATSSITVAEIPHIYVYTHRKVASAYVIIPYDDLWLRIFLVSGPMLGGADTYFSAIYKGPAVKNFTWGDWNVLEIYYVAEPGLSKYRGKGYLLEKRLVIAKFKKDNLSSYTYI